MREFKFRAWDGENMDYFNFDDLYYNRLVLNNGVTEPMKVMQFTGMYDKNGKEIYEGDIIRRDFEVGHTTIDPVSLGIEDYEIVDSGYFVGVVTFRPSEGYVLNKCKKYTDDGELVRKRSGIKIHPNYAEVIGDIYTNSNLI